MRMTVPNSGPQHPELFEPEVVNAALVYRDEPLSGDMAAASTRATALTHRFGGIRYALTRLDTFPPAVPGPHDGGDSDASH
jgi:hypothetical protein